MPVALEGMPKIQLQLSRCGKQITSEHLRTNDRRNNRYYFVSLLVHEFHHFTLRLVFTFRLISLGLASFWLTDSRSHSTSSVVAVEHYQSKIYSMFWNRSPIVLSQGGGGKPAPKGGLQPAGSLVYSWQFLLAVEFFFASKSL